ncbi:MAG: pimeloyl-ACP methyl ester esterase BioH [Hydrogenophilaceae bacterium]|nr:pimeloyl-ACP methyl ester esterase BioH [Hydrogenophilaceae bacterium]
MNNLTVVFLHGWGTHPVIWAPLQTYFPNSYAMPLPGYSGSAMAQTLDEMSNSIAGQIPEKSVLAGWSLGALVAMRIALIQPEKVSRLVLIGATPCFVNREDWPYGVADEVFEQFARNLAEDYSGTIRRFLTLQAQGSDAVRAVLAELRRRLLAQPRPAEGALEAGLDILRGTDLRSEVAQLPVPVTLIHGLGDKLAPVNAARWLAQTIPDSTLHEIRGAGHAPFLSHAEEVAEIMANG